MPISPPAQITVPFGTSGLKNTIPAAANPTTGRAGYDAGFPAINMSPVSAGGIPPYGQDMNGILFDITTALQYLEAGGMFVFSSSFASAIGGYPKGALLSNATSDGLWLNTLAGNTTNPDTGGAGWVNPFAGVVGTVRNVAMSVSTASATASLTADQIIVSTALGGLRYSIASFNKTINLAATGVGGMDTGSAPVSGFVGIYAIYNPTTGVSALLAVNATSAKVAEVYAGANMPVGYTASALLTVLGTNASSQLKVATVIDRTVYISATSVYAATTVMAITSVAIGSVPRNAKAVGGYLTFNSSVTGQVNTTLASGDSIASFIGAKGATIYVTASLGYAIPFSDVPMGAGSTLGINTTNNAGGTCTFGVTVSEYNV